MVFRSRRGGYVDVYVRAIRNPLTTLGPSPEAVRSRAVSPAEAIPWVLDSHELGYSRVAHSPDGKSRLLRVGRERLEAELLSILTDLYEVDGDAILEARILRNDASLVFEPALQPMLDGAVRAAVLRREADSLLGLRDGKDTATYVYALQNDVRLPLTLARADFSRSGVRWVTIFRPQQSQEFAFNDVRGIFKRFESWHFVLNRWRRRSFRPLEEGDDWQATLAEIRRSSASAGLVWQSAAWAERPQKQKRDGHGV